VGGLAALGSGQSSVDGAARETPRIGRFDTPDWREDALDHPIAALPQEGERPSDACVGVLEEPLLQDRSGPVEATD
jgi:hypothetical protein